MDIKPPPLPAEHDERHLDCEAAIASAVAQIEAAAVEAGWNRLEVAVALVDLGRARLQTLLDEAKAKGMRH